MGDKQSRMKTKSIFRLEESCCVVQPGGPHPIFDWASPRVLLLTCLLRKRGDVHSHRVCNSLLIPSRVLHDENVGALFCSPHLSAPWFVPWGPSGTPLGCTDCQLAVQRC